MQGFIVLAAFAFMLAQLSPSASTIECVQVFRVSLGIALSLHVCMKASSVVYCLLAGRSVPQLLNHRVRLNLALKVMCAVHCSLYITDVS